MTLAKCKKCKLVIAQPIIEILLGIKPKCPECGKECK